MKRVLQTGGLILFRCASVRCDQVLVRCDNCITSCGSWLGKLWCILEIVGQYNQFGHIFYRVHSVALVNLHEDIWFEMGCPICTSCRLRISETIPVWLNWCDQKSRSAEGPHFFIIWNYLIEWYNRSIRRTVNTMLRNLKRALLLFIVESCWLSCALMNTKLFWWWYWSKVNSVHPFKFSFSISIYVLMAPCSCIIPQLANISHTQLARWQPA